MMTMIALVFVVLAVPPICVYGQSIPGKVAIPGVDAFWDENKFKDCVTCNADMDRFMNAIKEPMKANEPTTLHDIGPCTDAILSGIYTVKRNGDVCSYTKEPDCLIQKLNVKFTRVHVRCLLDMEKAQEEAKKYGIPMSVGPTIAPVKKVFGKRSADDEDWVIADWPNLKAELLSKLCFNGNNKTEIEEVNIDPMSWMDLQVTCEGNAELTATCDTFTKSPAMRIPFALAVALTARTAFKSGINTGGGDLKDMNCKPK